MNEKIMKLRDSANTFWSNRSKSQKGLIIGTSLAIIVLIAVISLFATKSNYVPLYNNLSLQEVGQIKAELDTRGIPYQLEDAGTTILVPEEQADTLLVDLATQGIPNSGNIDYSFFSKNASWGMTDNEFNVIKLDAMQTELANLIKRIDGINDATVQINMPKDPVFVSDTTQPATASVLLETAPGYRFQGNQINALYQLVSKAVPNLSPENITIMNQYLEYYDQSADNATGFQDAYTYQQTVKRDVERDIQRRLQQMLGTMVGMDNVIVSVTADVDFTQENREEEIVEPADPENMKGLPVSVETIHETYSGKGANQAGGVAGVNEGDIPDYQANEDGDNGDYEYIKETVNNEFNRIHKEIAEAPYKIRDLGIQVAVDKVKGFEGEEKVDLSLNEQDDVKTAITDILNSIISTSIDPEYINGNALDNDLTNPDTLKTSIVFQEFSGNNLVQPDPSFKIPVWMYVVGGILLLIIIALVILLFARKPKEKEEFYEDELHAAAMEQVPEIDDVEENEAVKRRKQLEKLAKEKPEEFAKLLRGWIGED